LAFLGFAFASAEGGTAFPFLVLSKIIAQNGSERRRAMTIKRKGFRLISEVFARFKDARDRPRLWNWRRGCPAILSVFQWLVG
jgi:hypothetical protein